VESQYSWSPRWDIVCIGTDVKQMFRAPYTKACLPGGMAHSDGLHIRSADATCASIGVRNDPANPDPADRMGVRYRA